MGKIKNGIAIVFTGVFAALVIATIAYPQGAVTLVALMLGGTAVSSSNPLPITCTSGCSGGGSVTANQGTANTLANGWPVEITDGANGPAAVKAASTSPLATDPAVVVTTSPNSGVNATPHDCSSTVVIGGTAVNAFTAQTTLHGFTIANIDSTTGSGEPLWISFTTTAAASTVGSYPLSAPTATTFAGLSSFTTPAGFGSNHALSVVAASSGHKFSCTWW